MAGKGNTTVTIGKGVTLLLGVVILGVGLHSHFQSRWVKPVTIPVGLKPITLKTYKICENSLFDAMFEAIDKPCPSISLERYFVAIIIICFILSLLVFGAGFVTDMGSSPLKYVDLGYHAVAVVLLFVAGVVYIVSAVQIDDILTAFNPNGRPGNEIGDELNFRKSEKLAAGSLTIIQSLLYGAVAFLVFRS